MSSISALSFGVALTSKGLISLLPHIFGGGAENYLEKLTHMKNCYIILTYGGIFCLKNCYENKLFCIVHHSPEIITSISDYLFKITFEFLS